MPQAVDPQTPNCISIKGINPFFNPLSDCLILQSSYNGFVIGTIPWKIIGGFQGIHNMRQGAL
jgi:hypothetical protein